MRSTSARTSNLKLGQIRVESEGNRPPRPVQYRYDSRATYLHFEILGIAENEFFLSKNGVNESRRKVLYETLLSFAQQCSLIRCPHCKRRTSGLAGGILEDALRTRFESSGLPRRSFSASVASVDQVSSSMFRDASA